MTKTTPQKIFLKDYQPPTYQISSVHMDFVIQPDTDDIQNDICLVTTKSFFKQIKPVSELFLNGEELKLNSLTVNGKTPEYVICGEGLTIKNPPAEFELIVVTEHKPHLNTSLEGLYQSNGIFCTQCEAQGFRKITYFLDRPDVMTTFQVRIEADKKKYPILLSNGNRAENSQSNQDLANGRHQVLWLDPHKKPCYLFALVAGDLALIKDSWITANGKPVDLEIYAAHGKQSRCLHAMNSLKKSMQWDEQRFGREYDLSVYIIVAIDDFNAGAMENKGLNIFNSRLVLADTATATDLDYYNIESVVAHEYFHNWTGNRVTLRDWFHLSLKEGLTVFRDQEFSMDQYDRSLIRIDNVNDLRDSQFAEDAGPNAHPIRPSSCFAVDNFFTPTIYEKGSEVIRMMQTMVGRPGFRLGMDLYFSRHDGQAVIIEDFARAISDANKQDWQQFQLWYSQAGTPTVTVSENFDAGKKQYVLSLSQRCPLTAQESKDPEFSKKPFHIPLVFALLNASTGNEIALSTEHSSDFAINSENQSLLHLKQETQTFVFNNMEQKPMLSINRQFSAPIHLERTLSTDEQLFLMKHDTDAFNRWEACQNIYLKLWTECLTNTNLQIPEQICQAFNSILSDSKLDDGLKAKLIEWPSTSYFAQMQTELNGPLFLQTRNHLLTQLSLYCEKNLLGIYKAFHGINTDSLEPADINRRALKNTCLYYLSMLPNHSEMAMQQLTQAKQMTDQQEALSVLVNQSSELKHKGVQHFYENWKNESLVLNKWFASQASSTNADTFENVKALMKHPDFNIKNPNRVYSLLARFGDNISQFHQNKKETYEWMAEQIYTLDQFNPQVAARVSGSFELWTKLPKNMQLEVQTILKDLIAKGLSSNTHEIISKTLEAQ